MTAHSQKTRAVRSENQREDAAAPRARAANLGGLRLKLAVPRTIEGMHLYWANDQDGEVEQLLYEGFEFVTPEEVSLLTKEAVRSSHIVNDGDIANRVSRYVGRREDGSPLRAYLLKCPNEIWEERQHDRYEAADRWDEAVKSGQTGERDPSRYTPSGVLRHVDTGFRKQY